MKNTDRIHEIREQEDMLRRERSLLLSKQPWYRRPGSITGILAIIISITLFIINILITSQRKELSISYTNPNTLVFLLLQSARKQK